MPRRPQPEDLYDFRIPIDPRLSPDGRVVAFTLQTVAPRRDGYRHSIWLAGLEEGTAAASEPRQLTSGGQHDRGARFSPDGRWLAFLSDRRSPDGPEPDSGGANRREDATQVHLLSLDGGEARRLTSMPRGVDGCWWSPNGRSLLVSSASVAAAAVAEKAATENDAAPDSDYNYIDRLGYLANGRGFVYQRRARLWLVDVDTGDATLLTRGPTDDLQPSWSPDGTRIAFAANRGRDADLFERLDVYVLDLASRRVVRITGGTGVATYFRAPAWLPDGRTLAVLGHRFPANAGSRNDIWLFAADGSDNGRAGGRNLTDRHDRMIGAGIACDATPGEEARLVLSADGAWITFLAPDRGANDLWRVSTRDGRIERLTEGPHVASSFDEVAVGRGRSRIAFVQSDPTHVSEVHVLDVGGRARGAPQRITSLNDQALAEIDVVDPVERWLEVDGRQIQGWFYPATRSAARSSAAALVGAAPLVVQVHGGPHAFYGWAPTWEFQVLAGAGMSVFHCNPRGSDGYGQDFNAANYRDWAHGPMRDVLAGVDSLLADGLADPDRLGLTGGSYGGYLTNWIVAHDQRFRAAMTCRCVSDMTTLMLTGDISGGEFGRLEFGVRPWEDPAYYREISPLTHAAQIRTPLLIQHAEKDIRTTIAQAEALFTVLRSLRRPVRLMRVPEETHELTRSGTPFRRVENLVQVRDWFAWFLVRGRRGLPPAPKNSLRR